MNIETYERLVNYKAIENENDFNWDKGTFNVFRVIYPDNYYAMDQFITTNDLIKVFKNCDRSLEGFISEFNDYIEV